MRTNNLGRLENSGRNKVAIVMGSDSDWGVMSEVRNILDHLCVPNEADVISAHRTPQKMFDFARRVHKDFGVVVAGAGGAAHLPGMMASITHLPVIGVPILSRNSIDGWDSILSILQMPAGVPVATVALGGAVNAGILAAQILAVSDAKIAEAVIKYKKQLMVAVDHKSQKLRDSIREGGPNKAS